MSGRYKTPYNSVLWRRLRLEILERDGNQCRIAGPKCTGTATEVDHIVPISKGGPAYDPANLRAACRACNSGRANRRSENWRTAQTKIVLVAGPPCSGKTTFVAENIQPGDLRVDYDLLADALGATRFDDQLHSATMAARNALLRAIRQGTVAAPRVWIVSANPRAETIFPFHEVVVLDPGLEECLARCARDGRPPHLRDAIRSWYSERDSEARNKSKSNESSRSW